MQSIEGLSEEDANKVRSQNRAKVIQFYMQLSRVYDQADKKLQTAREQFRRRQQPADAAQTRQDRHDRSRSRRQGVDSQQNRPTPNTKLDSSCKSAADKKHVSCAPKKCRRPSVAPCRTSAAPLGARPTIQSEQYSANQPHDRLESVRFKAARSNLAIAARPGLPRKDRGQLPFIVAL